VRSYRQQRAQGAEESVGRRVGELSAATGLTVRALHYYEEIGLLRASDRSAAGHRLYSSADVQRLYRIRLLLRFGLPLQAIARALDDPGWNMHAAIRAHLEDVEQEISALSSLRNRLGRVASGDLQEAGPLTGDLLGILEEMSMLDTAVQQTICYLVYEDLEASFDYLQRVFDLGPGELHRDGRGEAVHGELQAGSATIWLHRETDDFALASPRRLGGSTAGIAVIVDDVDAHHRRAVEQGAHIDYTPVDQPYGFREYGARDREGGVWSFMRPLG
jgi:MerR family transcriptional regulator, thiopeptide resistance regulator